MEPTEDQVQIRLQQLARKMGSKRASILLSVLGKDKAFKNALETPIGQELLKDAVSSIEDKISLILEEKDAQNDRAELRAYMNIVNKWTNIINQYNKNKETFEKNTSL